MGKKSGPAAPPPDPRIGEAAIRNAQLGEGWLNFARDAYWADKPLRDQTERTALESSKLQMDAMRQNMSQADQMWQRYQQHGIPAEDRMYEDAANYDTAERRARVAGEAIADVEAGANQARAATLRDQARMGVNPNSGRAGAGMRSLEAARMLGRASAANSARNRVEDMGIMLRKDAANFARGMPGTAAQSYGVAGAMGQGAVGALGAAAGVNQSAAAGVGAGFGGAMQGQTNMGNMLNTQYQGQLSAWNQQNQNSSAAWGGLGSLVGTLGSAAIFASSKEFKEGRKPVSGEAAKQAMKGMPADTYRYKGGIEDGGDRAHVGPMAEDFQQATGIGDGKGIPAQDLIGVHHAAINGLIEDVEDIKEKVGA